MNTGEADPERHFGNGLFTLRFCLGLRSLAVPIVWEATHVTSTLDEPALRDGSLEATDGPSR